MDAKVTDEQKAKEQLIEDLGEARRRIAELEALEVERKQAEEQVRRLLDQQIVVNQLALALGEYQDLDLVYHAVYEYVRTLMDAEAFIVSFYDSDARLIHAGYVITGGVVRDVANFFPIPLEEEEHGTQSRVIRTGEPLYIPDWREAMEKTETEYAIADNGTVSNGPPPPEEQEDSTNSALLVPIKIKGETIGVMQVQSGRLDGYSQEDTDLFAALANQAAIAIENSRLFQAERQHRELAEALAAAAATVGSTLDIDQVLDRILEQVERIVRGDVFDVMLIEDGTAKIARCRGYERFGLDDQVLRLIVLIDEYPALAEMAQSGEPVTITDTTASPDWVLREGWEWQRSYVAAPIMVKGLTVGFLNVVGTRPGQFVPADAGRLQAFASHVGTAIENARLYAKQRYRAEEASVLLEIANAINSTLELDRILKEVTLRAARACEADRCTILLLDEQSDTLQPVMSQFASGRVDQEMWRRFKESSNPQKLEDVPEAVRAIQARLPLFVPDAHASSLPRQWVEPFGVESVLIMPLISRERVVGLMGLDHLEAGRTFTREQVHLAITIGGQAAVAIENARLHGKVRDYAMELERRVQERTAQLQTQYAQLEAILDSSSDGIIVAAGQGEILQANPIAETWLTHTLSPEDAARLREAVRGLVQRAGEWPEMVLELTGLDLQLSAAPITGLGLDDVAAVVAVHDVSHLKALDRIKSRFVSNVSHELRTPITTIKLYAELMKRTPEKWEEYLDVLTLEADRQARLVEGVLQISRIDLGRLEIRPRPISLDELAETACVNHQTLAQERGLTLEYFSETGPVALADQERITQVLTDLVSNAIQYTPEGGRVAVSVGEKEAKGRAWATVTVTDTGMGIPEEELPRIFERFFRGEQPQLMQLSGTGLGLALAKEIVELHGGWVTVESEEDAGSTFTVWLPLAD
jgi:signal transduction histidine kinase/putative methionine-R-sulfoxide reductase with GAF domain